MLEGEQTTTDSGGGGTTATSTGGDSTTTVALDSSVTGKRISAGAFHTCAVLEDKSVTCWGAKGSGQATEPISLR